jgi:hypothetical protein
LPIVSTRKDEGYSGKNINWRFCLVSSNKLDLHWQVHLNEMGCKVIMFEHIDVYYMTWYIIHGVFKAKFVNQQLMPKKAC